MHHSNKPIFQPHDVDWTTEKVSNFWTFLSNFESFQNLYFSKMVAADLVEYTQRHVKIAGEILDFGCGHGFLLKELLKRGIPCKGVDANEKAIAICTARLSKNPLFKGAFCIKNDMTSIAPQSVDVLFLIETIEHILENELTEMLAQILKLLKRGGMIVVTTPNKENLEAGKTICPECGCIFHKMQHVRSFDVVTLSSLMARYGLETIICKALEFKAPGPIRKKITSSIRKMLFGDNKPPGYKLPHLVYIGKKSE